ncbi:hypothetical protein D3C78_615310 [compost metagenome]
MGAALAVQLDVDVAQVGPHRGFADEQAVGDFAVAQSFGEQTQHAQLAFRKQVGRRCGGGLLVPGEQGIEQCLRTVRQAAVAAQVGEQGEQGRTFVGEGAHEAIGCRPLQRFEQAGLALSGVAVGAERLAEQDPQGQRLAVALQCLCLLQGLSGSAGGLFGGAAVQVQTDARQCRRFDVVGVGRQVAQRRPDPRAAGAVEQFSGTLQVALQEGDPRAFQARAGDQPGQGLFVAERFQLRQQQVGPLGIATQAADARQYAIAGDQLVRGRHHLEHRQIEVQQALGFRQFVAFVQCFGEYGYGHDTAGQMAHGVRRAVGRCCTQAGDGAA